jgi:hypothetical protein
MDNFWIWVILLVGAWVLEAVGSAAKKRKRPPSPRVPPSAPPARRQPAPRSPARQPARGKVYLPEPVTERRAQAERVVVEVPVARFPRSREPESTEPIEGVTAEVEAAEARVPAESVEPQHVRALEKYGAAEVDSAAPAPKRNRFNLRPASMREAVLWTEILGRPKGGGGGGW